MHPLTDHSGITHPAGSAIVDHVTGQQGTILAGTIEHTLRPSAGAGESATAGALFDLPIVERRENYSVALSNGAIVTRAKSDLLHLPRPPAGALEDFEPAGAT
jgi:hypothetical protein